MKNVQNRGAGMKTTIDKEFFKRWKDKEVAMWCTKEEYAEEFCRLMHVQGLRWNTDESYLSKNIWGHYKTETSYSFNTKGYGDKYYYESEDYTILDFEDYIVEEKITKQELVELMIENFTDEYGALDLSGLDFTEFNCSVDISHMKVSGTLVQNNQKVQGDLFQNNQEVQGSLYQSNQEVRKNLFQRNQYVEGDLSQCDQKVQGHLFQSNQDIQGNLWQNEQSVQGDLIQDKANETKQVDNLNERTNNSNNIPAYYNIAGIDTMDLILTICEHNNTNQRETFYLANTLKYLIRYNNKNGVDDLNKAKDYLNRLIDQKILEEENFYNVDGQGD